MKRFLSILWVLVLLGTAPCVQAQKWRGIKKIFLPPKETVSFSSLQSKMNSAVLRAVAKHRPVPYIAQVDVGGKTHYHSSVLPLLPQGYDVFCQVPAFPLPVNPKEMYRGMVLGAEGKDLVHILENGLEVSKSHYYEEGMSYDGKRYPPETKAIYVTTDPELAAYYITDPDQTAPYLPVVFHLKRMYFKPISEYKHIVYTIPHDIPPSWIYRVSALLKVNGRLMWGELKVKDKAFVFIPYPPKNPTQK